MIYLKNGPLYQWDINRVIEIHDSDNRISEIHCCREGDEVSLQLPVSRHDDKLAATIPNIFLTTSESIYVYTVYNENDEVKTADFKIFHITPRQKPAEYVYEETQVLTYKKLEEKIRCLAESKADLDENGKLRPEQLPDIVVKDETGGKVQADYNQCDSSMPDYIRNRPFYEKAQRSRYSQTETSDPVSFVSTATNHIFYKISDIVVKRNSIYSGELKILAGKNGALDDVTPVESNILLDNNDFLLTIDAYAFLFAYREGRLHFNYSGANLFFDVPQPGIYCVFNGVDTEMPQGRVYEITLTEEIKQIDLKFLPLDKVINTTLSRARQSDSFSLNGNTCSVFRKVVCCGDSLTAGYIANDDGHRATYEDYAWPGFMSRLTGNEYINCGVEDADVFTWLTSDKGLIKAESAGKAQAYLVGLGLSDSKNSTLGTYADIGTDAATYYAGMSKVIRKLNAVSPEAKIFLMTMPADSQEKESYNEAIRIICDAYKDIYPVYVLDLDVYKQLYFTPSITQDAAGNCYTAIAYQQFAENLRYIWSEYINSNISEFRDIHLIPCT